MISFEIYFPNLQSVLFITKLEMKPYIFKAPMFPPVFISDMGVIEMNHMTMWINEDLVICFDDIFYN